MQLGVGTNRRHVPRLLRVSRRRRICRGLEARHGPRQPEAATGRDSTAKHHHMISACLANGDTCNAWPSVAGGVSRLVNASSGRGLTGVQDRVKGQAGLSTMPLGHAALFQLAS